MKNISKYILVIILTGFALLTLFLSSSVIFDWFEIRAKEGNYVLFVVWANFISSLLYLGSIYGIIKNKKWAVKPLFISIVILVIAEISLLIYINLGGIYETKTVYAMLFRIGLTLVFSYSTYRVIKINKTKKI